jgi:hypothetical protein
VHTRSVIAAPRVARYTQRMKKLFVVLVIVGVAVWLRYRGCDRHDDPARHHAWDASKPVLSSGLDWIINANVVELRASSFVKQVLALDRRLTRTMTAVNVTCGIDALSAIDSVVVAGGEHQYKAIVVALDKLDRKAVETCLAKLAKLGGRTGRITERDGITAYTDYFDDDVLAKWIGTDVVALAIGANGFDEPDVLRDLTKGGLAGDTALLKLVTSPRTSWYAQRNSELGDTPAPAYTTAALRGSDVIVDMRIFPDPAEVESLAGWLHYMLEAGRDREDLRPLIDGIEIHAEKDHVRALATWKDDDVLRLLKGMVD